MARSEYYRNYCALCGRRFTARDLDKVYVRRGTYGRLVTMACLCQNCTARMADYLGIELPEENDIKKEERIPPYSPPKGGRARRDEHKERPDWSPDAFEKLWAWYPGDPGRHAKRGNRQRAIRAWDKLHPSPELVDTIAEALSRQAESDEWAEGVGIPHLSTYLNGWGWEGWENDHG